MEQIKNGTGQPHLDILASVMVDILILFHSSADCERKNSHLSSKPRQLSATKLICEN